MTWRVGEQDFNVAPVGPGRAIVHLVNGTSLSIITPERNAYIREQKRYSPSAILHGWSITDVQADEGTYEVAALDRYGNYDSEGIDPEPRGWAMHRVDSDGIIYERVPPELIDAYVNEVGVNHEHSE